MILKCNCFGIYFEYDTEYDSFEKVKIDDVERYRENFPNHIKSNTVAQILLEEIISTPFLIGSCDWNPKYQELTKEIERSEIKFRKEWFNDNE